jgi:hypothetical protein
MITIFPDDATWQRLLVIAAEKGRSVSDLCEAAVSEACLAEFRNRADDPAKSGAIGR